MAAMAQTQQSIAQAKTSSTGERVATLNWSAIISNLDDHGCATIGPLLTANECTGLAESYDSEQLFRSRVIMARHGFGRGEYKHFAYPLPRIVAALRDVLYPALAQVANRCNKALGIEVTYPSTHAAYLRRCRADEQSKPRHCFCAMVPEILIVCTRIFTAKISFRFKWRFFCPRQGEILLVASSCSPSNDRACNRAPRSCR